MPSIVIRDGCRDPDAMNFDHGATGGDNLTCKYLIKHDGVCHYFYDVQPAAVIDKSFTLSYSAREGGSWVFFHDYIPDYYVHIRENLFTINANQIYKHNDGPAGSYYSDTKPFFIDIIFRGEGEMLLEDVQWVSEFITNSTDQQFNTLSHISIWNSNQHSGRIPLSQVLNELNYDNTRRTKGEWSFDDFRDVLVANASTFLGTIFNNYALDPAKVDLNPVWYNEKPMEDSWFCIRFEFDNAVNAKVILHDTTVTALKSDR